MELRKLAGAALLALGLAGCGGGMQVGGGPSPESLEGQMLAPDPMSAGAIDDATGTMIGS